MDTQEELDHNEAKVYPKGGATTELEISLTVAENPEKKHRRCCSCDDHMNYVNVSEWEG